MSATVPTPPPHVISAEEPSKFISGLKAMSDRLADLRRKAAVVGIDPGRGFISDYHACLIEKAYAEHLAAEEAAKLNTGDLADLMTDAERAEYNTWLAERDAEIAGESIAADLDAAAASPVTFPADHTDDKPSRRYRPELIEEPQERRVYTDSDGRRYTEW